MASVREWRLKTVAKFYLVVAQKVALHFQCLTISLASNPETRLAMNNRQ